MVPLARAKTKSRLSQTRLTTPQKPRSIPSRTPIAKTARSKPNQSILNFFKKAPLPDEDLFIGEGRSEGEIGIADGDEEQEDKQGEEGVESHGSRSPSGVASGQEEDRFNELGGAVKKRRLSPGPGDGNAGDAAPTKTTGSNTPAVPKRKAGNPFLDDSDSDSDSESSDSDGSSDDGEKQPDAAVQRVRSPQPVFEERAQRDRRAGPAELTSATPISRKVPLLRQQTSGDDTYDGSESAAAPDGDDRRGAVDDAGGLEYDDFTGEELQAMRDLEEQARLEVEEEGEAYETSAVDDGEAMTASCPVCNGSLVGATPDQATAHVNSCLDGNPTPLPKPPAGLADPDAAVSTRAAKAAVARPGQANPISLGTAPGEGSGSAFAKLMSGHAEDTAWATAAAAEAASRGLPAYKRTCPFYKIMPGFSICVDAFRYGAVEGCRAYFLSHFHSDHYVGLTASWTHGPIYCSKVTGSLVKSQLKTAATYVVELEFEETVPIPGTDGATVTMIPANHCPGSSLFLFEKTIGGRLQRILHCGDFRACPAHVEHPKLRPEIVDAVSGRTKQQKIDVCYLDTTYLNPRYSFPPQSDVIAACAELCARLNDGLLTNDDSEWDKLLRRQRGGAPSTAKDVSKFFAAASPSAAAPTNPAPRPRSDAFAALDGRPNRLLVVCGTYSIGKERICVAIAKALRSKIYATPAKIRMCHQLDDPELTALLTPDPAAAQVHMQMLMEIRAETLAEYLDNHRASGRFARVVGFRPSGWNYRPSTSSSSNGSTKGATVAGANLPPTSLPTAQLLHGPAWRPRFAPADLVPQRGSSRAALCFGVPYSEHSSFRELALFVMALRVERVVPTVNVGSEGGRRRMRAWLDRWLGERRRGGLVRVVDGGEGGEVELWEGKDGRGGGVCW